MALTLDSLLANASDFISSEFSLQIQESQLKIYSPENWEKFYKANKNSILGFQEGDEGLYVPLSYSAYVRSDSPVLVSNIFHELHGHGLFCEHSGIGRELVEIAANKKETGKFLYGKVDSKEQLFGLTKQNIDNYEGFSLWLEALLCKETGNTLVWDAKKGRLPRNSLSLLEYFQDAEKKLTRFGFMSQLGFPKYYNNKKIVSTLKHLYGNNFNNIDFIVLYGSQKPERDIDLFIVSNNQSNNLFNGWLDIYELNKEEFQKLTKNLDISVTDPLFGGSLIYGNISNFEQMKNKIKNKPIAQETINHNIKQAKKQEEYLGSFEKNSREEKSCKKYIQTYKINAQGLSNGEKLLTLDNIRKSFNLII